MRDFWKKHILPPALAAILLLGGGLSAYASAASPDPTPSAALTAGTDEPSGEASGEPSGETSGEATLPLVPGTYEGGDGSVLKVKKDGTCTYATDVSGKLNGKRMTGRLTFHGTVEGGVFSFTKVTYYGLDLTDIAASLGFTDASFWEEAAGRVYADALAAADEAQEP